MCICDRLKLIPTSRRTFPLPFRYPSGVRVQLQCDSGSVNGSLNGCLLPFRCPSGILTACRQNEHLQLNGAPKWPRAPNHQNGLESFRYPSGGPNLRACPDFPVWEQGGQPHPKLCGHGRGQTGLHFRTLHATHELTGLLTGLLAGLLTVLLTGLLTGLLTDLLPFRYPSGILPACR